MEVHRQIDDKERTIWTPGEGACSARLRGSVMVPIRPPRWRPSSGSSSQFLPRPERIVRTNPELLMGPIPTPGQPVCSLPALVHSQESGGIGAPPSS
jgi:hypothetical protein